MRSHQDRESVLLLPMAPVSFILHQTDWVGAPGPSSMSWHQQGGLAGFDPESLTFERQGLHPTASRQSRSWAAALLSRSDGLPSLCLPSWRKGGRWRCQEPCSREHQCSTGHQCSVGSRAPSLPGGHCSDGRAGVDFRLPLLHWQLVAKEGSSAETVVKIVDILHIIYIL